MLFLLVVWLSRLASGNYHTKNQKSAPYSYLAYNWQTFQYYEMRLKKKSVKFVCVIAECSTFQLSTTAFFMKSRISNRSTVETKIHKHGNVEVKCYWTRRDLCQFYIKYTYIWMPLDSRRKLYKNLLCACHNETNLSGEGDLKWVQFGIFLN